MADLRDIATRARCTVVVQETGDRPIKWRVRRLDRRVLLEVLGLQILGAAIPAPVPSAAEQEAIEAERAAGQANAGALDLLDRSEAVACRAVEAVSLDGETWDDVRLVPDAEEDVPSARLGVSTLDADTLALVALAASAGLTEGVERIRPFRVGPGSTAARPGGPEVPGAPV